MECRRRTEGPFSRPLCDGGLVGEPLQGGVGQTEPSHHGGG